MKRRSLLGALLGLPAGAALGAVLPEEGGALSFETKVAGPSLPMGPWTAVVPEVRLNDAILCRNEDGVFRWIRTFTASGEWQRPTRPTVTITTCRIGQARQRVG